MQISYDTAAAIRTASRIFGEITRIFDAAAPQPFVAVIEGADILGDGPEEEFSAEMAREG